MLPLSYCFLSFHCHCFLVFVIVFSPLSSRMIHSWSVQLDGGNTVACSRGNGGAALLLLWWRCVWRRWLVLKAYINPHGKRKVFERGLGLLWQMALPLGWRCCFYCFRCRSLMEALMVAQWWWDDDVLVGNDDLVVMITFVSFLFHLLSPIPFFWSSRVN